MTPGRRTQAVGTHVTCSSPNMKMKKWRIKMKNIPTHPNFPIFFPHLETYLAILRSPWQRWRRLLEARLWWSLVTQHHLTPIMTSSATGPASCLSVCLQKVNLPQTWVWIVILILGYYQFNLCFLSAKKHIIPSAGDDEVWKHRNKNLAQNAPHWPT